MSIRSKFVAVGFGLSILTTLALAVASTLSPSDEVLRARFLSHRVDFERLAAMANEDSQLTRIAPNFTWLDDDVAWPRTNVGISDVRWNDYRRLFGKAGASRGILKGTNPDRIIFPIASEGLAPTGFAKGLVYSQTPLTPALKSLDKRPPDKLLDGPDRSHLLAYKPISDHWYIYYEQW